MAGVKKLVRGVGINDVNTPVKGCKIYTKWASMLQRGYDTKLKNKMKCYEDTIVCEEWHIFSNFKRWVSSQIWEGLHMDKDILLPGINIYCPENCAFVPGHINLLLTCRESDRGEYPIGVSAAYIRPTRIKVGIPNYKACISVFNGISSNFRYLGTFPSVQEAHSAWQLEKANQIRICVDNYRSMDCFRGDVANALLLRADKLKYASEIGATTVDMGVNIIA